MLHFSVLDKVVLFVDLLSIIVMGNPEFGTFRLVEKDMTVNDTTMIYSTMMAIPTVMLCSSQCLNRGPCQGFSYEKSTKECHLFFIRPSDTKSIMICKIGVDLYEYY